MTMLVIEGVFRIEHAQPDGDSIRFYPTDASQWGLVPPPNMVQTNATGGAQLRLDAIDALETHYSPGGGPLLHQPLPLAEAAASRLLELLGFSDVVRDAHETVTSATPGEIAGFILTRTADEYGRCVALAGKGAAPAVSGTFKHVDKTMLETTLNFTMIAEGLVYPTYYSKLYVDLRKALTSAVKSARSAGLGIWANDVTESGVDVQSLATLTDQAVILPKLFRRLTDYLHLSAPVIDMAGFPTYLEQRDDRLWVISSGQHTGFGTIVEVAGETVRLNHHPEDLVFDEA